MSESGKKKIIIIGPAYPYRGGPSTFVSYIYRALQDEFEVRIYNYKLLYPSVLFPGKTQYDESKEKKFIVPSERIINSINPLNWLNTASRIRDEKADLIIFDWWHPFFGACHYSISLFIKKQYHKRIVFITENFISHEQNSIDRILTRIGLSNADTFIALSAVVEEELKKNFPGKKIYRSELPSFDIYSELKFNRDTCRKELGLRDRDKVLLFFGYIRKYKGLDILLRSMPAVLKKLPETKLLIVGEFYDKEENYLQIISELGLSHGIILINRFVPNEDVGKYYTAADLNILPYRSATQSAVLNVSFSFNTPVVAANVGGLSEFVKNNETGIIVEPDSPDALADGIIKYFNLSEKIDFGKNIRKAFSENRFSQFPEILKSILKEAD